MTKKNRPTLNIDLQEFEHFLSEVEGTEKEKQEYLELVWQITREFALLGFGLTSVQIAKQSCGKDQQTSSITTHADSHAVESESGGLVKAFVKAQEQQEGEKENA